MRFKVLKENIEQVDSEGNLLTPEQIAFFKNSKVRNGQGRLLVCYHGTNASFSKFEIGMSGKIHINKTFNGIYLAYSKDQAICYRNNIYKLYANICNPLKENANTVTRDKIINLLQYLKFDSDEILDYDNVYKDCDDMTIVGWLYDLYDDMPEDFYKALNKILGFDGIIYKDIIIAFLPNNVKLVSNKTPTNSNNINEDLEGLEISTESVDAYSGQVDMIKKAIVDNNIVGTLEYTICEDTPHIQMIQVSTDYRRKGIATQLLRSLQKDFPNTSIDTGMRTEDGVKLFKSVSVTQPNEEYVSLSRKLANLKKRDEEIDAYWEEFWDKFDMASEEERDRMRSESDKKQSEQDDINGRIRDIESMLYNIPSEKTFIK